jgi:hypothetical protein
MSFCWGFCNSWCVYISQICCCVINCTYSLCVWPICGHLGHFISFWNICEFFRDVCAIAPPIAQWAYWWTVISCIVILLCCEAAHCFGSLEIHRGQ